MKRRFIVTTAITACLALCAIVWPQTGRGEKTPTPSKTTAVTAPQPTLPEAGKLVLPAHTPEIEDEPVAEQKSAPPTQTDPTPVQPTQSDP